MKKILAFLFTLFVSGGLLAALFTGFVSKSTSQEHLAEIQMTQIASSPNQPTVTIPPEAWQPISPDYNKALEYGLTIIERTLFDTVEPSVFAFNYSETNWSIFLWRENISYGYHVVNANEEDGDELVSFSGIACGVKFSYPQKEGEYNYYFTDGTLLSRGVWDIVGPEERIKEFILYTEFTIKNTPLCQLTGYANSVNSFPAAVRIYPFSEDQISWEEELRDIIQKNQK